MGVFLKVSLNKFAPIFLVPTKLGMKLSFQAWNVVHSKVLKLKSLLLDIRFATTSKCFSSI